MTKKIKILRKAKLYTHRNMPGVPNLGDADVCLLPDSDNLDLGEDAKKISGNHIKYEVRLAKSQGYVHLVEGVDFEFV
jgi:hypothetical protein